MSLANMKIGARLWLLVVTAVLGVFVVAVIGLVQARGDLMEGLEVKTQHIVEVAHSTVGHYHAMARAGEMSEAEAQRAALAALEAMRYDEVEYIWVNDLRPVMLMHPINPALNGQDLSEFEDPNGFRLFVAFADTVRAHGAGFVNYFWPMPGHDRPVEKVSYVMGFEPWGWVIGSGIYIDNVDAVFMQRLLLFGGIAAVLLLGVVGVSILIRGSIVGPLNRLTTDMSRLAEGDTAITVADTERPNEIGALARALEVFRSNAIERERMAREQEAEQERKNRRQEAVERLIAEFDATISGLIGTVSRSVQGLNEASQTLTAAAEETSTQSATVAAASEQASTNVQTVASAAEELSASVTEISRQVSRSSQIAGEAVERAERSNHMVQGLAEAADRIGEVVTLISDIAEQTNLLALNATIEAARAGDAGKGFAVVANEVKNLANQTAKATEDISNQIAAVQQETKSAVQAIQDIGRIIGEIDEIASSISAAVEEQGAATQEIARNVQQAAAGTQEVSSNITGVSQAAGETGATATQVASAAGELEREAERLKQSVETFLSGIRAA